MARIRSVHPGLFTDEAFAGLSHAAQVLFIGIWTECDDQGVFEWKPIGLKMRIFPAANVDVSSLLAEMEAANMVRQFSHDDRQYGAVRNFCTYQKPKFPKFRFSIDDNIRAYVRSKYAPTEMDGVEPSDVTRNEENSSLMERSRREVGEENKSSLRSDSRASEIRIPDNWRPSAEDVAYAQACGLTEAEINRETEKIKNHARQEDRRCADWSFAFRNWALRSAERMGRGPPQTDGEATKFVIRRGSLEAAAWEQHRGRPINFGRTDEATMPTQWPPGHEQSDAPQ